MSPNYPLNVCRRLAAIFLLAGIITRVYLWAANPKGIWLDEASLTTIIYRDSWLSLLHGNLDFYQSAPLGFLALVKAFAIFFGDSIQALRFFPLVASCLSLGLIWRIGVRAKFSAAVVAAWLFFTVICYPLLWYADEFKQYAGEVFFALLYLDAYVKYRERLHNGEIPWRVVALICAGFFFTLNGFFELSAIFGALLLTQKSGASGALKLLRANAGKIALMIFIALGYYLFYLRHTAANTDFMRWFWGQSYPVAYRGEPLEYARYVGGSIVYHSQALWKNVCAVSPLPQINGGVFAVLTAAGLIALARRRNPLGLIVALLIGMRIFAFVARAFPLGMNIGAPHDARLMLSLFPFVMLPASVAVGAIIESFSRARLRLLLIILLSAMLGVAVFRNGRAMILGNTEFNNPASNIALLEKIWTPDCAVLLEGPMAPMLLYAERARSEKIPFRVLRYFESGLFGAVAFFHLDDPAMGKNNEDITALLAAEIATAKADGKRRVCVLLHFAEYPDGQKIIAYLTEHYALKSNFDKKTALLWIDL